MKNLILLLSLFVGVLAVAQENQEKDHGPRAGKVLGSGAVLAEVVWHGGDKAEVYFLSPDWIDLQVKGATVTGSLKTRANPNGAQLSCVAGAFFNYSCSLPEAKAIKLGDKLELTRILGTEPAKTFEFVFPSDAK